MVMRSVIGFRSRRNIRSLHHLCPLFGSEL